MKTLLELWLICSIFTILFFVIETWRLAWGVIKIPFTDHLSALIKEIGPRDMKHLLLIFLLGPISIWVAIRVVNRTKKEFFND